MEPFAIVLFAVVAVALIVGVLSLIGRERAYEQIGRGSFALDRADPATGAADQPAPGAPPPEPSLEHEVRQLVLARNERLLRAGERPLDVDAEVARQLRELSGG